VAGVCIEETGFRRETGHCLRFEKSAGSEDAERPEAHSQAEPGNEEIFTSQGVAATYSNASA
jgi:hypothetical protein